MQNTITGDEPYDVLAWWLEDHLKSRAPEYSWYVSKRADGTAPALDYGDQDMFSVRARIYYSEGCRWVEYIHTLTRSQIRHTRRDPILDAIDAVQAMMRKHEKRIPQ